MRRARRLVALVVALLLLGAGFARAEQRVALVIGNAAYRADPLDNPVNDARLIARRLTDARFAVTLRENLDQRGLQDAIRQFGAQLRQDSIAVFYYAGHGLQLRDRNFLIPIDADIQTEEDITLAGIDVGSLLDRMSRARSRVNIVILDACRNNPFAGRSGPRAQGLAQMDAPVGTLLAFATGPGKLAADFGTSNGVYARHLAQHMLTPGVPVESMFQRVRRGVVQETQEKQIPWEASSLQDEFAFIDRGVELAKAAPSTPQSAPGAAAELSSRLPRVGDTWRYRVQDRFRIGDLFVTARVDEVRADAVTESWTASSGVQTSRPAVATLEARFHMLPGWDLTPPEFAPYLQAAGPLTRGRRIGPVERRIGGVAQLFEGAVEGEDEVAVPAGRFRATRVVLRAKGAGGATIETTAWYATTVKRLVKYQVLERAGRQVERTVFELVEFSLH